jgi:adenine-specific DNA-methyltransferase
LRYIGGKSLIIDKILEVFDKNTAGVNSIFDVFSGSGVVAEAFKQRGCQIFTNDLMYFSYVISRGSICMNDYPKFENLSMKNPIEYLNNLKIEDTSYDINDCFIYKNYSPNSDCERMYFQNKNAIKIDIIRKTIEDWKSLSKINEDEYYYLLASLICAVPYVSNIAGVYGAFLKHWDKRTYNDLVLKENTIIKSSKHNFAYNENSNDLALRINADLAYLDPPYNSRQYLPNYHILETIAKYDSPKITGVTGLREYRNQKSLYCQKAKVAKAFKQLLDNLDTKYIIISYNNEGLLSCEELSEIVINSGISSTFKLYEIPYRRYKSKIPNNDDGLKEQIYFIRKK